MKWKAFSIIMLLVGLIAVGSLGIAEEADSHPLDGRWTLNFEWKGATASTSGKDAVEPDGTTSLSIQMSTNNFGSFTTGDGGEGWVLNPSSNTVLLIFTVGCKPIYLSKNFNGVNSMSGFMFCREPGSVKWGTWNATKP